MEGTNLKSVCNLGINASARDRLDCLSDQRLRVLEVWQSGDARAWRLSCSFKYP